MLSMAILSSTTVTDLGNVTYMNSVEPGGGGGSIHTGLLVLLIGSLSFIMIISLVGNALVLYVITKHLQYTSYTNAFIASLSVSDILTTLLCMPTTFVSLIHQHPTIFNNQLCALDGFLNGTFGFASTFMLTCISIDRYYVMGNVPRAGPGKRTSILAIFISWAGGIFFAFPWYALLSLVNINKTTYFYKEGFYHCMYLFHVTDSNEGIIYGLFVIVICYITPIVIMIYCCLRLWNVIRQTDSRIVPVSAQPTHVHFTAELRTAKSVIIMVLLYITTRGPYLVMGLLSAMIGNQVTVAMDTVAMWLFWSNCAINPIVYAVRNPNFSEFLKIKRQSAYRARSFTNIEHLSNRLNRSGSEKSENIENMNGAVVMGRGSLSTARGSLSTPIDLKGEFPAYMFYTNPRKSSVMSTMTSSTTITTNTTL